MSSIMQDDARLHKFCHDGKIEKIKEYIRTVDRETLNDRLNNRRGVFGYTPLHEAVSGNKSKVIPHLTEEGANVNARANSGYTPLHLAASAGHIDCVKVLLENGADISLTDDYGKTPKQTAGLSSKSNIVRLLRSEEIIKEVKNNGDNLTELLRVRVEDLEPYCLEKALIAAVEAGNHFNVGKLVVKGATNIDDALKKSIELRKHDVRAMLLLVIAAKENDKDLVLKLFGAPTRSQNPNTQDDDFAEVQKAVISGRVSTVVPIEIARRNQNPIVREELLLRTDVNQEEGSVYWHGLRLLVLDLSWIRKIHWVKRLRLARNGFRSIPNEIGGYLKQVVKLDLQHNELSSIPRCLLELPSLNELNLCFNHLTEIPDVHEWSPGLTVLDVSNNELTTLPLDVVAVSIRTLNLSNNKFRTVPLCVCSFTSLQYLNISYNPDILSLPVEMGRLSNLNKLLTEGLKDLSDPPRNIQKDARDCIRYLNSKLRSARKFYRMKLMLVGKQDRGKTTLVARLQGLDVGINQSTVGVDVSEWHYAGGLGRKKYQFSIWDFGGQEEYYATHQCFLSERSMYLLLWNVKHGEKGIAELKPWLDNIALRAPRSCVLIVGSHLDEVEEGERPMVDELLGKVAELASDYQNKLVIPEVLAVGLMNRLENIGTLREAIYNQASEYKGKGSIPVMGQEIPASYFQLNKELEKVQEEVHKGNKDPVMHVEQFKNLVQELKLPDICSDDELRTATLFLNEVGTILHYDDRSNRINELYFIDPRWLCKMMSEIVTVRERNPFVKNGILHSRDVPFLFRDPRFPWQYFERYLTLLDRFEIALPLDNRRILIPSMLPDERPDDADIPDDKLAPLYFRFIIFSSPTPPGFWSRLISRVMHTVPQVCQALDALADQPDDPSDGKGDPEAESSNSSITDETSAQQVSISSPMQSPSSEVSFLLPNIKRFIVGEGYDEPLDRSQFKLRYWKEGIVYQGPDVSFAIESLKQSKVYTKTKKRDGIIIMSSPTGKGTKVICQLVDIILSLIHEWYPGLEESTTNKGVEQRVPCYECRKLGRSNPFEFKIDQYMSLITSNRPQIECGYDRDANKNHKVALTDIMPDLLLQDLDAEFLLKPDEIKYQEDQDSLLGEGGFGKVYRGKCRGKSVAIKKYLTRNEDAFNELRSEAKVLQKSHHPCLVCLVGVSVYPLMALVLEEAPMGSLERHLLKKSTPVPRLVMFRIAAQVAAALRFLHQHGIIFRDLKAANVLVWSLDEASLCHSKVTDFGIATHLSPVGVLGIQGTKGFIAPEVLFIGKKKAIYNHRADIFSFGMLLYQMIARRHPFHNVQPVKIDTKVVQGDRPSIVDTPMAETGYFYLTRLMERCWHDKPDERPETSDLIVQVSNVIFQSVMGIHPVRSRFSLRRGCAITPHDYAKANVTSHTNSELWICCDGSEGAELNIYNTNRMVKLSKNFIKENQVQCMCVCGDHVWVCSRAGIEYGVIDIFSMISRELVHNIRMRENAVSCITCSDTVVYLGTLEGYCFAFDMDLKAVQTNCRPKYRYISEHAIDGIVVTKKHVWVSHTRFMFYLNLDTLQLEHSYKRSQRMDAFIGHLAMSTHEDKCIVWSSHLGGSTLSAWDAETETHLYDIDVREILLKDVGIGDCSEHDAIMTCMTPAMDAVWVGMATGHILVFHEQELLLHMHPYTEYMRFLIPVPCEGPCQKEKCMVVSGAKGFQSPLPEYSAELPDPEEERGQGLDKSGVMILWEAYSGETLRQMRTLQESPHYLDNHKTVARMVRNLHFKDDTHILEDISKPGQETELEEAPLIEEALIPFSPDRSVLTTSIAGPMESSSEVEIHLKDEISVSSSPEPIENQSPSETLLEGLPHSYKIDAQRMQEMRENKVSVGVEAEEVRQRARSHALLNETLDIDILGLSVRISCPKPVLLSQAMAKVESEGSFQTKMDFILGYRQGDSGEVVHLTSQEKFDHYLEMENRPMLLFVQK